jgi:soluble P-type ATPase
MITVKIPGWKNLIFENLLMDFNGTLAIDGVLVDGVADRLKQLSEILNLTVLTADTFGTATQALADLPVEVKIVDPGNEMMSKRFTLDEFGTMNTVYMGNGANDEKVLSAATVGIAVLGREGIFGPSIAAADIIVQNPNDGLDLLLNTKRLIAGLRR